MLYILLFNIKQYLRWRYKSQKSPFRPLPLTTIKHHSIHHHSFGDDTQLRKSASPHHVSELVQSKQECIHGVKLWMSSNKLKLSGDKTEAIIVSSQRLSTSFPMPDSLTVGTSNVKTLGVTLHHEKPGCKSSQNCKFRTPTHSFVTIFL